MEHALSQVAFLQKYRSIEIMSELSRMCAALGIECVCNHRDDSVDLNDLVSKIDYALKGFLSLFVEVNGTLKVKETITDQDIKTAETYYNFAFMYVHNKKRKKNGTPKEITYIKNNIQCVMLKILNELRKSVCIFLLLNELQFC